MMMSKRRMMMTKYLIGAVIGWFAHVHYAEQIMGAIASITGGQ